MFVLSTFGKDPDDKLDYMVDWAGSLDGGDSILTSVWAVEEGSCTISNPSNTATTATVWIEGGVNGEKCVIRNRVTTAAPTPIPRTMDQSIVLYIRSR
jgi:hypothetical protein